MKTVKYCLLLFITLFATCLSLSVFANQIIVGAQQTHQYLPLLKNKRVGVVVNQTSTIGQEHLVDKLVSEDIDVKWIFAPEHGFRGDHDAGASVKNSLDAKTGIEIYSIYGKTKKPSTKVMSSLDVIVFDIQDVGVRFYTYISSMHYMMEAAAESGVSFIVLDRPNPNGAFVEGPVLDMAFQSFVGMHPIPVVHGLTVAELAQMIKGERWINEADFLQLSIVPVANYSREMAYSLPVAPSPNLPNDKAIQLYPSLCLFEPTQVSIGRGTDFPFQVVGAYDISLGEFSFTPESRPGAASNPKLKGKQLGGLDLRKSALEGFDLSLLFTAYQQFNQQSVDMITSASFFDKLAGTDSIRKAMQKGQSYNEVKRTWQPGIDAFKKRRKPYLIYPDIQH